MNKDFDCESVRPLLPQFVGDELPVDLAASVTNHLTYCTNCQRDEQTLRTEDVLSAFVPRIHLDYGAIRTKIEQAIENSEASSAQGGSATTQSSSLVLPLERIDTNKWLVTGIRGAPKTREYDVYLLVIDENGNTKEIPIVNFSNPGFQFHLEGYFEAAGDEETLLKTDGELADPDGQHYPVRIEEIRSGTFVICLPNAMIEHGAPSLRMSKRES